MKQLWENLNVYQLCGGAKLDFINNFIAEQENKDKYNSLFHALSFFDIETNDDIKISKKNIPPSACVIHNILSRGLPTKTSIFIENNFADAFPGFIEKKYSSTGNISYTHKNSNISPELFFRALHLIDPRYTEQNILIRNELFDSKEEEAFISKHSSIQRIQLFQPQVYFNDLFYNLKSWDKDKFIRQKTDFALKPPYSSNEEHENLLVVEIDGKQHQEPEQSLLDQNRTNHIAEYLKGKTERIPASEMLNEKYSNKTINNFINNNDYYHKLKENWDTPLWTSQEGLSALELMLIPFAVVRIQKVILQYILSGKLSLSEDSWSICIFERDLPCARLAINDLNLYFSNISRISIKKSYFPKIKLSVIYTKEFKNAKFRHNKDIIINNNISISNTDLFIDISIMIRSALNLPLDFDTSSAKMRCIVRSSYMPIVKRKFLSSQNELTYSSNCNFNDSLTWFLQSIFRKKEFRNNQQKIITRILSGKNALGLLPTGAGKSLIYQLAGILKPGIIIVIAPIKSLMKDQKDSMKKLDIDAVAVINSSISANDKKVLIKKMQLGRFLFTIVAPERMQMSEFRNSLIAMQDNGVGFSLATVDEAHCVSEWGHDFRTCYLSLGKNLRRYCKTLNDNSVNIIGLTATASYDVLSDIKRELELNEKDIITAENLQRNELHYHVINCNHRNNKYIQVHEAKNNKLLKIIEEKVLQNKSKSSEIPPGIIFAPHKTNKYGVKNIAENLNTRLKNILSIATYMSRDNTEEALNIKAQEDFLNDKINLLVATKAFGMGIDKPNIRYTIHFNYPISIESFYQEAGRAGRDRQNSDCYILFAGNYSEENILLNFFNNSFKGQEQEIYIIKNILNENTFSSNSPFKLLQSKIYNETSINVNIRKYGNRIRIWQRNPNREIGQFIINTKSTITYLKDLPECKKIMSIMKSNYLNNDQTITNTGILDVIDKCQENETTMIIIGFENNSLNKLKNLLSSPNISITKIKQTLFYSNSFDEFSRKLNISQQNKTIAKQYFLQHREQQDTEKSIYRLSIIGLVDEYNINYNSNCFNITLKKLPIEQYIKNLQMYFERYISVRRAESLVKDLYKITSQRECIYNCVTTLISFIYNEIGEKRKNAIFAMKKACEEGIKQNGDYAFRSYVDTYFNSKYYRYLINETNHGKYYSEEIIINYAKKTADNINELMHLRGATVNLLQQSPHNVAFLLLYAYSITVLNPDENKQDAAEHIQNAIKVINEEMNLNDRIYFLRNCIKEIAPINMEMAKMLKTAEYLFALQRININLKSFIKGTV